MDRVVVSDEDRPLWWPTDDGWDVNEWAHDDSEDPPSLYTLWEVDPGRPERYE
jgi:hypothetical protein